METAKILVVEDDADINGLLTAILKKQGYEVTSAFSGSEAGLSEGQGLRPYNPKKRHKAQSTHRGVS